jgi:hypothetical protein
MNIGRALAKIPVLLLLVACLTLGLAPFLPEPHIWEKLKMLFSGTLTQPVDLFDFAFHGLPWVLLGLRLLAGRRYPNG